MKVKKYNKSKTPYPSKDEILQHPQIISIQDIRSLKKWKYRYYTNLWNKLTLKEKTFILYNLIEYLRFPELTHYLESHEYASNLKTQTIFFKKDAPSIISTLHEIGHLLYGESELKACAYSFQLFNAIFPKEIAKLTWQGHMLVKNK